METKWDEDRVRGTEGDGQRVTEKERETEREIKREN